MGWSGYGMNGWGYLAMAVGMLIFIGAVITGVVAVSRRRAQIRPAEPRALTGVAAADLLDARFARGEIDEQEYTSRRETLAAKSGT